MEVLTRHDLACLVWCCQIAASTGEISQWKLHPVGESPRTPFKLSKKHSVKDAIQCFRFGRMTQLESEDLTENQTHQMNTIDKSVGTFVDDIFMTHRLVLKYLWRPLTERPNFKLLKFTYSRMPMLAYKHKKRGLALTEPPPLTCTEALKWTFEVYRCTEQNTTRKGVENV